MFSGGAQISRKSRRAIAMLLRESSGGTKRSSPMNQ